MKVEKYRVLGELIETNKRQFVIPVYQRNYDWGKQHCKKLYDDIISAYELDRFHFIGSIVYVDQGEENKIYRYLIIDGQQRITTLFLLLKALLDSTEDENLKKEFEDILFNIYTKALKDIKKTYNNFLEHFTYANPREQKVSKIMKLIKEYTRDDEILIPKY